MVDRVVLQMDQATSEAGEDLQRKPDRHLEPNLSGADRVQLGAVDQVRDANGSKLMADLETHALIC